MLCRLTGQDKKQSETSQGAVQNATKRKNKKQKKNSRIGCRGRQRSFGGKNFGMPGLPATAAKWGFTEGLEGVQAGFRADIRLDHVGKKQG